MSNVAIDDKLVVTICGAGNASHVLMGQIGSAAGVECRVFVLRNAHKFETAIASNNHKIVVNDLYKESTDMLTCVNETVGTVDMVSSDPARVVPGSHLILIPLPVFAHKAYLQAMQPFLAPKTAIGVLPGQGGSCWMAEQPDVLGPELYKQIIFFGTDKLPYNARVHTYAHSVNLVGLKETVGIASTNFEKAQFAARLCSRALGGVWKGVALQSSLLDLTLMPVNQCLHTCRMYDLFHEWDGQTPYAKNPLFYHEMSKCATQMMEQMDEEIQQIALQLTANVPQIHPMLVSWYNPKHIGDASTLLSYFRTNQGYAGIGTPMTHVSGGWIPDYQSRYFTEDIPYGLAITKGIALMLNIKTPTIDKILIWAQGVMGKEYLVDGEMKGKDINETHAPQAFEFTCPKRLKTC